MSIETPSEENSQEKATDLNPQPSEENSQEQFADSSPQSSEENSQEQFAAPSIDQKAENSDQQAIIGDKNTQNVDKSTINNIIGEINNYTPDFLRNLEKISQDRTEEKKEKPFDDPTTSLPPKPRKSVKLESDHLPIYTQKLKEENLLVISCFNQDVLFSSAYAVANNIESLKDKRLLSFEGKNSKRSDLGIELLAESEKIGEGKGTLIVIDAVRTQTFWDSLIVYSRFTAGQIKQNLKNQDRFLICLADPEMLFQNLQRKNQEDLFFDYWEIPFLPYLLKTEFPNKAHEFEEKINKQREQGLWGDTDREFSELVYGFIKNGQLSQEIEKRENLNKNADTEEIEQELKSIRASDLFKDDEIIENTVLYVATFFPNISPNDFLRIVYLLLGNDPITVSVKSEKITKKGKIKEIELKEQKLAREIWKKKSDKIKKKCGLKSVKFKESSRVIDFSLPYLRKELKEYFEEEYSMFLQQKFQAIQELGLLFDASLRVTENVILLYTSMAISYPEDYGDDWLVEIILQSTKQFELDTESGITQEELLLKLLEAFESEMVFSRISNLIREMLNYPQLEEIVKSFLEQLISWKRHDAVLAIVKRLRFAPQFDEFYWINQLLERGRKETCEEAYRFLYNQARQSGFRIYEFLEKIQTWLPEPNREKNYSQANQSALRLFIEYCLETTSKIPIKHYGQWPSKYPLFSPFSREENETKDYLDILVTWLLHPGLKNSNLDFVSFLGGLLAEWWAILYGFKKNNVHQEAIQTMNELLKKVIAVTTVTQQEKIIYFWIKLRDELLNAMDSLLKLEGKVSDSSEEIFNVLEAKIDQINRRQQIVNDIVKRFNQLKIQLTTQSSYGGK